MADINFMQFFEIKTECPIPARYTRVEVLGQLEYALEGLGELVFPPNGIAGSSCVEAGGILNVCKEAFEVHKSMGISYSLIGDYSKAEEHLNICISLRPTSDTDVYHLLGDLCFKNARYEEAVHAFVQSATIVSRVGLKPFEESSKWWTAGAIASKFCKDDKQAAEHFVLSLKAALQIQKPDFQAAMLNAASICLFACIPTPFVMEELWQANLERVKNKMLWTGEPLNVRILQAEGYGTLGLAKLACQAYDDDAQELLQRAIDLLTGGNDVDVTSRARENLLLFQFLWSQASLYSVQREDHKALDALQKCKSVAPTESGRLRCDLKSGLTLKRMGKLATSAKMFAVIEMEYSRVLESESELKAQLLLELGQHLLSVGNRTEATERLESAKCLLEEQGCYTSRLLPLTYCYLYAALIQRGLFPRALELFRRFNLLVREHHAGGQHERYFNLLAAQASRDLNDIDASRDTLAELVQHLDTNDQELMCFACSALANVYLHQGDYDAAEAKYSEAISIADGAFLRCQIYLGRAVVYLKMAAEAKRSGEELEIWRELNRKAKDDHDQGIEIIEGFEGLEQQDLATAHSTQATILQAILSVGGRGEQEVAGDESVGRVIEGLDRDIELAGDYEIRKANAVALRAKYLLAAYCLSSDGDQFEEGMRQGEEAALFYAELQLKLEHIESAWVTLLDGGMKLLFFELQRAWVIGRRNYMNALLWAERSRLRLYFHLADQRLKLEPPGSLPDPLAFDRDDGYAQSCIADAVKHSGSRGCAFVEYTCCPDEEELYIFVVRHESELRVNLRSVKLKDFFSDQQTNRVLGGSINVLVRRTRSSINAKLEDKAKAGLGALYRLLVEPVWELLKTHETIIFAPAGSIWLVPFAALYDEACSQFLIQKKKVGVIPSLRALRRCQIRHEEAAMKSSEVGAFVAGDPEPMGLRLAQLPGARQEAIEVAEQLGVTPLIGRSMTKESVIEGLKSVTGVIALVTHGVVNTGHPHGALVMQGEESQGSQVLTAREIGKVDMHAELVVLSACQTGEGEVPSEGLLGLARAVLQAGSCCAVVTLWRVDDDATKELMTGMFRELMSNKRSVVESLRVSMLKLLESGAPVYKWASAAALGYSMLSLSEGSKSSDSPTATVPAEAANVVTNWSSSATPATPRPKWKNSFCCWKF